MRSSRGASPAPGWCSCAAPDYLQAARQTGGAGDIGGASRPDLRRHAAGAMQWPFAARGRGAHRAHPRTSPDQQQPAAVRGGLQGHGDRDPADVQRVGPHPVRRARAAARRMACRRNSRSTSCSRIDSFCLRRFACSSISWRSGFAPAPIRTSGWIAPTQAVDTRLVASVAARQVPRDDPAEDQPAHDSPHGPQTPESLRHRRRARYRLESDGRAAHHAARAFAPDQRRSRRNSASSCSAAPAVVSCSPRAANSCSADCRSLLGHAGTVAERAQALRRGDIKMLKVAASALTIDGTVPDLPAPILRSSFPAFGSP